MQTKTITINYDKINKLNISYSEKQKLIKKLEKELYNKEFELTEEINFVNKFAIESLKDVCLMKQMVKQTNQYINNIILEVIQNKESVEQIFPKSKYLYYDLILTNENLYKLRKKLAEKHFHIHGNTQKYRNFANI